MESNWANGPSACFSRHAGLTMFMAKRGWWPLSGLEASTSAMAVSSIRPLSFRSFTFGTSGTETFSSRGRGSGNIWNTCRLAPGKKRGRRRQPSFGTTRIQGASHWVTMAKHHRSPLCLLLASPSPGAENGPRSRATEAHIWTMRGRGLGCSTQLQPFMPFSMHWRKVHQSFFFLIPQFNPLVYTQTIPFFKKKRSAQKPGPVPGPENSSRASENMAKSLSA